MHFYTSRRLFTTAVASIATPRLSALRVRTIGTTATALATAMSTSSSNTNVVSAAVAFLEGEKRLVDSISPTDFTAIDAKVGGSVGGHVRHTLDHFQKCLAAARLPAASAGDEHHGLAARIRYDHRMRGGDVETDPAAASDLVVSLLQQLQALQRGAYDLRTVLVNPTFTLALENGTEEFGFDSNLERELYFCCHHGIHHDAMIKLILRGMGERGETALGQLGANFGVAPSTADFRRSEQITYKSGKTAKGR